MKAAERLAKADRPEDAKASFDKANQIITAVASELEEKARPAFDRSQRQLEQTHAKLVEKGVQLPPLGEAESTMDAEADPRNGPEGEGRFARGQVSFVTQIAPLLDQKCGRCHVDSQRGAFSLASYDDLMRGTRNGGRVLVPGEGSGGVMMDLIESGDMPRGGLTMSPQETAILARWITQGARFDGDDPQANLRQLKLDAGAPAAPPTRRQTPPPAEPTRESTDAATVSFAVDVAPVLVERCNDCHVLNNRGNLRFATFQQLLRSDAVTAGAPDRSSLVRHLRGDDTPRMPMNAPPLPEEQIEKIATWIREGARFDGANADDPLTRTTAVVRARLATTEELNAIRLEEARRHWRLALPDEKMETHTTDRFAVAGAVPQAVLRQVADAAESAAEQSLAFLGGKPGDRLGKSRLTLFVFDHPIDYSEFALMVEKRKLPQGAQGHAQHDPVAPYACLVVGRDAEEVDPVVVLRQVTSLSVSERTGGKAPRWLADAAGRAAAAKTSPKAEEVKAWNDQLPESLRRMRNATDFMTGAMPRESAGVVGYHFVSAMRRNSTKFTQLLSALADGTAFEDAFRDQYGASPQETAEKWRNSKL